MTLIYLKEKNDRIYAYYIIKIKHNKLNGKVDKKYEKPKRE